MFAEGVRRVEAFNHAQGQGDVELTHCGYEKCVPAFACHLNIRHCHLIHYVLEGHGYFTQSGRTHAVGPGEWFIIYPGQVVTYRAPDPDDPWVFAWFGFTGAGAAAALSRMNVRPEHPVGRLKDSGPFLETLKACADAMQEFDNLPNSLIRSHLFMLLYHLETPEQDPGDPRPGLGRTEQLFRDAIAFIGYNYSKSIMVHDLYRYMNLDRTYVWRIFQQHVGMSPQQYLMQFRVDKAAELLVHSSLSPGEAARCVGIHDLYYFSRIFKKLKGCAPSRFKARWEEISSVGLSGGVAAGKSTPDI